MQNKFGFVFANEVINFDETILPLFWHTMETSACDFTNAFRNLNKISMLAFSKLKTENDNNNIINIKQSKLKEYLTHNVQR